MNLLAFDTSTEQLSIALAAGEQTWTYEGPGGARASTELLPRILTLMAEAQLVFTDLHAIVFGRGPGSFTGLRTACSVAQGLAFAAARPVLPVDTLLAVAEQARVQTGVTELAAALDARMNEIYLTTLAWVDGRWTTVVPLQLCAPEALPLQAGQILAGNVRAVYGDRLPSGLQHIDALPSASALLRLAPTLLAAGQGLPADQALPLYFRDKVAKTTAERMADKALAAAP